VSPKLRGCRKRVQNRGCPDMDPAEIVDPQASWGAISQSRSFTGPETSLNSSGRCLKVVDTFRIRNASFAARRARRSCQKRPGSTNRRRPRITLEFPRPQEMFRLREYQDMDLREIVDPWASQRRTFYTRSLKWPGTTLHSTCSCLKIVDTFRDAYLNWCCRNRGEIYFRYRQTKRIPCLDS
jgi:hypothetical protein